MQTVALIFALAAAALHIAIFAMESALWRRPAVWQRFNVADQAQADSNAQLAYNQGFYNLFLAIAAIVGPILVWAGADVAGWTLVITAVASMTAAATVLTTLGARFLRPALTQGVIPLAALVLSILAIA
jgi:putative membrane protein